MNKKLLIQRWVWKIMKITIHQLVLFVILCGASYGYDASGQSVLEKRISLDVRSGRLKKVLELIEAQASVRFVYSPTSIDIRKKVDITAESKKLEVVLKELLLPHSIGFVVSEDNVITLRRNVPSPPAEGAELLNAPDKDRRLQGRVTDEKGEPLPGVNILIKGSKKGTASDGQGNYSLELAELEDVLVFSFVGYVSQELSVGSRSRIDISLKEDERSLDELVVVGYGTVKKENVTGAISKLSAESLSNRANTTLGESFAGQISGITAKQLSARPGAQLDIVIRGQSSLSSASTPLYIVDGIPGSIDNINPNDIESLEILKDAASTAIYGARGGNGVILVTTKQGSRGKPVISLNSYFGMQEANKLIDMMDRDEFLAYSIWGKNVAYMKLGGKLSDPMQMRPGRLQYPDSWNSPESLPDVNWQKAILQTAPVSSHQISVAGGNDQATFMISGHHLRQDGIVKYSHFNQTNFRVNTQFKLAKDFKVGLNIAPSFSLTNNPDAEGHESAYHRALAMPPIVPLHMNTQSNGVVEGAFANFVNPLETLRQVRQNTKKSSITNNVWLEYVAGKFKFRTQLGYNYFNSSNDYFRPADVNRGISIGRFNASTSKHVVWQNTVDYSETLLPGLELNLLAGQSLESRKSQSSFLNAINFPNDLVPTLNTASQITGAGTSESENSMASLFGRANFNVKDKYLLTFNVRRDGSSRFGRENRWGWFPSVSAGWKIDRENFLKDVAFIDLLKVRASIGKGGSDNIGDYSSVPLLGVSNYSLNGVVVSGLVPSTLGNPMLGWEKVVSRDIGIDFNAFRNRFQLSVNLYSNITTDMLFNRPVSPMTGFNSTIINLGKVRNRGYEIDITTVNISASKLRWESKVNLSSNQNKVLKMDDSDSPIRIAGYFGGDTYITMVGQPIGSFYGFKTNGVLLESNFDGEGKPTVPVLPGQIPGNERIVDANNDGVIGEADRVRMGDSQPDFNWGFSNRFTYGPLDFSFLVHGSHGAMLFVPNQVYNSFGQVQGMNSTSNWVRSWKPSSYPNGQDPFPDTNVDMSWDGKTPLAYSIGGSIPFLSDRYFHNASFVRLKNISLGYSFNTSLLNRIGINYARIFVMADNVHTWTTYPGVNPEANGLSGQSDDGAPGEVANPLKNGTDWGAYPLMRKYSIGINLKF